MEVKDMKKLFKKYGILAGGFILGACAMQGCYIDADDCRTERYCTSTCSFDRYGNAYDCTDVCKNQEICRDDHRWNPPQCYNSYDCPSYSSCVDGFCVSRDNSYYYDTGYVQTCGYCSDSGECAGKSSACTLLASGEQVCTMPCSDTINSSDCPNGYLCVTYGESYDHVTQCLPMNDSCDPNYCVRSSDCLYNGDCLNNRCVAPYNHGDNCRVNDCARVAGPDYNICYSSNTGYDYCTFACSHDLDCGGVRSGYACALTSGNNGYVNAMDSGVCLVRDDAYCKYSSECPDGLTCAGGRCTISCRSDADCQGSYAISNGIQDYYCAGGYCRMVEYYQYLNY
jgi:hypothetical protein